MQDELIRFTLKGLNYLLNKARRISKESPIFAPKAISRKEKHTMPSNPAILLETQYLPSVQYLSKFLKHPQVWIEGHEHYTKGSYRNRCYIAAANGPLLLSIPLQGGKNQQQDIRAVQISYETNWASEHWTSIKSAYGSSPYFEHYGPELERFYKKKQARLFDFNTALLKWILKKLKLEVAINVTTAYEHRLNSDTEDWRNAISPKAQKRRDDPCFEAKYYPQVFESKHGFLPNLSILDLLFCAGPQAVLLLEESIT